MLGEVVDAVVEEPALCLWRAPTSNDRFARPAPATRWDGWGLAAMTRHVDERGAGFLRERYTGSTADVEVAHTMTARRAGEAPVVEVEHVVAVPPALDDLPRVGVRLALAPGFDAVEWIGLGPHESYCDRRACVREGRWHATVAAMAVPYAHPQANGNRHGVRTLRLGDGVRWVVFEFDSPLDVTVAHVTDHDLDAADHLVDLRPRPETYVWLDAAHRGVGTGAVGPDTAPRHRVGGGTYRWGYTARVLR